MASTYTIPWRSASVTHAPHRAHTRESHKKADKVLDGLSACLLFARALTDRSRRTEVYREPQNVLQQADSETTLGVVLGVGELREAK